MRDIGMRISSTDSVKANNNFVFKKIKQTTHPWEMDIFESCEPKPLLTKQSTLKGKNLEEVYLKPNKYEASIGLYKTRKVLNSKIGKLEGTLLLKIADCEIGEASRFSKIEVLRNVQADKLQSTSAIILSGDNTKVNEATTSKMDACASEINSLNCDFLTAKDSVINSAFVKGIPFSNSDNDKTTFLDIYNTKIGILNINPTGEYQLNNSHICKLIIPESCKKNSFYPSFSILNNEDSVIGSVENQSKYPVTVEFYKDGKFILSKLIPQNTCLDTETLEKYFEEKDLI